MPQTDPKPNPQASTHLVPDIAETSPFARLPKETGDRQASREGRLPPGLFEETLNNAQLLLLYAAEAGIEIDDATHNSILEARAAGNEGLTEAIAANLLVAESKLAARLRPVTAESLKAHAGDAQHTVHSYLFVAIALAIFVVPASVATFVTSAISSTITKDIAAANALAVKITSELESPGAQTAGAPASLSRVDAITDLQTFASTMRAVDARARQLNWFIGQREPDPLEEWRPNPAKKRGTAEEAAEKDKAKTKADILKEKLQLPVPLPQDLKKFAADPKIAVYQDVRSFGQGVVDDVSVFYGAMNSCILPVLYALLGTCAYLLRTFEQNMTSHTFIPSHADSPRFLIAGIGGAVVGLFSNFAVSQSVTIPPLAIAFLVGYAVDVFFSFLEGLIRAFTRDKSGTSTPAAASSGNVAM